MSDKATTDLFMFADVDAFRGVIDSVPHPIFVKDDQTRFIIMNEMMCNVMNRSFHELVGKTDYDFVPKEQADVFRGNDLRVLNTGEANENEELFTDRDGTLRTIVTRKKRLLLADGRRLLVGCITDISDFRKAEALVQHHANHDALTSLPNRRLFSEKAKEVARLSREARASYALLLIDLDRFKPVNDIYGHTAGDTVLCEIASRLKRAVRAGDIVARLGGDEFAVICEPVDSVDELPDTAIVLANRILAAINEPVSVGDHMVDVGGSIGIALGPKDGDGPEAMVRCADMAMYRAKREGRGRFIFFEPGMDLEIRNQAQMEADLRQAISQELIRPYYQPLVKLPEGTIVGFEVLARWDNAQRGLVEPELFIPIAERLGLISSLTFSLLREACKDATQWPDNLMLAINLSTVQLADDLLPIKILGILNETGFLPSRLEVEITESALVGDLAAAKSILMSFQNLGMKVSLDDFGTGYSSMYHLRELQFDKIKIDRSFIKSMTSNPESDKIVKAILGLTRSLGLVATAEGIEDDDTMKRMIERGCEFGQGFHFGRAVPASEASLLVASNLARRKSA